MYYHKAVTVALWNCPVCHLTYPTQVYSTWQPLLDLAKQVRVCTVPVLIARSTHAQFYKTCMMDTVEL
jgi:hypothetical protein